ncbi:amino acid kinase family protein [Jiella marina]|uniref:amino acid kinase family protein n=1 Tax=Jiella sp. LLJ827 TaxID=2917712 RepID=UPI002100E398|nr:amino acid kinase [Jiella sp. LLJ827]MCQ0987644.1 amino acid kinase [Jiella sp. LLJ827]
MSISRQALVIKLGGSSAGSPDLTRWVAAIEQAGMPVVVVPGGGPFADTVRRYQPRLGFDDEAAHEMAILGMEQFGLALVSLGRRLVKAKDRGDIQAAWSRNLIPVWLPRDVALGAPDLRQDWTVTSDSLAAWLARRLLISDLCLIKQIDIPEDATVDALIGAQIIDESFTTFVEDGLRVHVAGPADLSTAAFRLTDGRAPGRRVGDMAELKAAS